MLAPILRTSRSNMPQREWRARAERVRGMASAIGMTGSMEMFAQPDTPEAILARCSDSVRSAQHAMARFLQTVLDEDALLGRGDTSLASVRHLLFCICTVLEAGGCLV
jgi:hypothetical protein